MYVIYGASNDGSYDEYWSLIKACIRKNALLWLMIGDFHELLNLDEKEGGCLIEILWNNTLLTLCFFLWVLD